ncbi:Plk4 kinase, partial [Rozella allomycis CSF55]
YSFGKLLGKGAFGNVYEAEALVKRFRVKQGDQVAIKVISLVPPYASLLERVKNEIRIMSQLSHPNVLAILDYYEDDNNVYIVMEKCSKGELFAHMRRLKRPLKEDEAVEVFRQVALGVQYLHSKNIIHRDLKCSNILLNENMQAKIADFGLAVIVKDDCEQKTMCGTLSYISPEIVTRKPYGIATDIWSLGCILYTLVAGCPPFHSDPNKKDLSKIAAADFKVPSYFSPQLTDLVQKLLKKNPIDRLKIHQVLEHPFLAKKLKSAH